MTPSKNWGRDENTYKKEKKKEVKPKTIEEANYLEDQKKKKKLKKEA